MNRLVVSFALFGVAVALLFVTLFWYLFGYQSGQMSMGGVMGQMMGGQYGSGMASPMPSYVWLSFVSLFLLVVVGAAGMGYYLAFPEIRTEVVPSPPTSSPPAGGSAEGDWSMLIRTSKPEERKVLDVLAAHDGRYLQKFIVKEAGLSRLKTHRIISRFAERGIVVAKKSGNTNDVALAPWLHPKTE